jgi:chaperone BCS1
MVCLSSLPFHIIKPSTNMTLGVASHEGRVLVMTTNRPEKLDEALIRPGRVDHQVAFSNATQTQIKELFERMYADDGPHQRGRIVGSGPGEIKLVVKRDERGPVAGESKEKDRGVEMTPPDTPIGNGHANGHVISGKEEKRGEDLSGLASEFSKQIQDHMFSPAEIQGFLLKRKKDPRKAVLEVTKWVEGMREVKSGGGDRFGLVQKAGGG